jgi:hypothetical protein
MKRDDRAALKLAFELARRDSRHAAQLDALLAEGQPWQEVAEFAAQCCQRRSLRLQPWQAPPCIADERAPPASYSGNRLALDLLRRMRELKVSRWHPRPLDAIARAEKI